MPPKVKTEHEKQQLKTLIIDAGRELFVTKGVEAVSMREIAKQIGYSATSIYHHFNDKQDLLRSICHTDLAALASTFAAVMQITEPVERMIALGKAYANFALSHPNHYRLMFMTPHPADTAQEIQTKQNYSEQDAYFLLKTAVTAVYEAKRFKPELNDVNLIAQTIWAGMHGVCALHITMAQDASWIEWSDVQQRLQLMHMVLMRGLLRD